MKNTGGRGVGHRYRPGASRTKQTGRIPDTVNEWATPCRVGVPLCENQFYPFPFCLIEPETANHIVSGGVMRTRKVGNSDLNITPVGYGAWAIGGSGWDFAWGTQDDADSIAAIHRSLELGVNWIDTAAVYGVGHSEEVVARALKDWYGP